MDYDQEWYKHMWSDRPGAKTLSFYRNIQGGLGMASYLKERSEAHTKYVAKLRMGGGGHNLAIEVGKCHNIPPRKQYCGKCSKSSIGDEYHFVTCPDLTHESYP